MYHLGKMNICYSLMKPQLPVRYLSLCLSQKINLKEVSLISSVFTRNLSAQTCEEKAKSQWKMQKQNVTHTHNLLSLVQSSHQFLRPCAVGTEQFKIDFHTSPRHQVAPLVWIIVRPIAQIGAIISARLFRKWWKKLPEDEKIYYKKRFHLSYGRIAAAVSLLVGLGLLDYFTHIQETPITKRKRFIAFTPEQFLKIVKFELNTMWEDLSEKVVPDTDPMYDVICEIANKIVQHNQDLDFFQKQKWTVLVINSPEENAFILPTGHIFVYTGLLKALKNKDQLAVILGHEMAHALLSHGAEQVSFAQMMDVFIILIMAAAWALLPNDGIALVTQWFYRKVMHLLLHLPYNRKLESEADEVGLQLIAKACYDVRESSTFWNLMSIKSQVADGGEPPEWLSTHPASDNRAQALDQLIPKAIEIRNSCKCAPLHENDPRNAIKILQQMIKEKKEEDQKDKQGREITRKPSQVVSVPS